MVYGIRYKVYGKAFTGTAPGKLKPKAKAISLLDSSWSERMFRESDGRGLDGEASGDGWWWWKRWKRIIKYQKYVSII